MTFLSPWLLAGLAALPIIYWLLRTVPPRPRLIRFPATRILVGLENPEKTPDKTPWWLMLIRMLAAALVILALAQPILNPDKSLALSGDGPVVLVIDNGWATGNDWAERQAMVDRVLRTAEGDGRSVIMIETAGRDINTAAALEAPAAARTRAAALVPQPFAPERAKVLETLRAAVSADMNASAVWLSDGMDHGDGTAFGEGLSALAPGGLTVVSPGDDAAAIAVSAGLGAEGRLNARIIRAFGGRDEGILHALSARGEILSEARFSLQSGETDTAVGFELPLELRNQVTRVIAAGVSSAGATHLLDARSRWNRIGLVSGASQEQSQPLLGPLYYIRRALAPFAEMVEPKTASADLSVTAILDQNATIIVLADIGTLAQDTSKRVLDWVQKGGVMVRFAGPRLEQSSDELLPIRLRAGGRTLGGALSWSIPQSLSSFGEDSLFAGLDVPADVRVSRQVLADPGAITEGIDVWARLADGTPLVTSRRVGEGRLVLFHVTANSDWSNLPLSGLFVEMLRRITTLGTSSAARSNTEPTTTNEGASEANNAPVSSAVLAPTQVLDGFGQLVSPPATAKALSVARFANARPSKTHPPGYYGAGDRGRALNVATSETSLTALGPAPSGAATAGYGRETQTDLKPWCLGLALALLMVDILAVLAIQFGGLAGLRTARQSAAAVAAFTVGLIAFAAIPGGTVALAQDRSTGNASSSRALAATSIVTFGYVLSGDPSVDSTSKAGLEGLVKVLAARTSVEPGEPMAVNIDSDEIAFFPILYWPVVERAGELSPTTLAKVDAYMKRGGMIVFDTRDYGQGLPMGLRQRRNGGNTPLQRLLGKLDIPPLEPVPEGHVLTKSFYLLRTFPGRWDGGQLWVEATARDSTGGRKARRADGVSSILITPNDLASAWALDNDNRPMFPVVPGGERQREWAFRTGINIVMYALTGNYKADQVHVPSLLQRLGQ
ncbi:MAG: DUF4159 domain-containing protein [Pseudomonadota bacterium]